MASPNEYYMYSAYVYIVFCSMLAACSILAAAAAAECRTQPLSAKQAANLTACKVLIVGAGPGGLYSAYFLRELGKDLCIVEKKQELGGKQQATEPPKPLATPGAPAWLDPKAIGTCGLRINQAFADQRCLASRMGIRSQESDFDSLYHARGQWHRNLQSFLGNAGSSSSNSSSFPGLSAADLDNDNLEPSMLEYAFVTGTSIVNPVTGKSPKPHAIANCAKYKRARDYLIDLYGQAGYNFLLAGASFCNDWEAELDLCGYITFYTEDWQRPGTAFYPEGGFRRFHSELRKRITATGVRIFTTSPITCLADITASPDSVSNSSSNNITYRYAALTASGSGWRAERLILNPVPSDLLKIGGSLGERLARRPELNSIKPARVAIYNAYWPSRWWDKYATRTGRNLLVVTPSDSRCLVRSKFPSAAALASVNASRPIYTDDPKCIAKWQKLYQSGGTPAVRKAVVEALQSFFPSEKIPQPVDGGDAFYLASAAWHYLGANASAHNITVQRVADWALAPLRSSYAKDKSAIALASVQQSSICMVGEAYFITGSGWSWGALQSAMRCLRANFADLMSKEAKTDMEFIRVGCQKNSTRAVSPDAAADLTFEGEVRQAAGIQLPRLNPATGRLLN